jgi:hypothetical protein
LELHPNGHLANWRACRFGFVVNECVTKLLQQAKQCVQSLPRQKPEEGYGTGFILSVHFTLKLQEDFPYYKFFCAMKLRDKHPDLVMVRRDYYMTQSQMITNTLNGRAPHPLLVGQPMYQYVSGSTGESGANVATVGGGCGGGAESSKKEPPTQSVLSNRLLCYEKESVGLRCPICLEEEGLSVESCVMFTCAHYVCDMCYPKVEGSMCPLCRKQIKVSVD